MEPEIIKVLNHKLIPDLVNIVNDYLLTPLEYYGLIDQQKYTVEEFEEYRNEYEKNVSEQIKKIYDIEYTAILEVLNTEINLENLQTSETFLSTFEKNQIKSEISYKYKKLVNDFFIKYLRLIISELHSSRIFKVTDFKENLSNFGMLQDYTLSGISYLEKNNTHSYEEGKKCEIRSGRNYIAGKFFLVVFDWVNTEYVYSYSDPESLLLNTYCEILYSYYILTRIS